MSDDRNNLSKIILSVAASICAICSLGVSVVVALMEFDRSTMELRRLTLQEIRTHKLRISELDTVFVCMNSLLGFPQHVGDKVRSLRKSSLEFQCKMDWCWQYRRCVGKTSEEILDNEIILVGEEEAWRVARPILDAMESYETLARLACTGALETQQVLDALETELYRGTKIYPDSPPISYIERFYSDASDAKRLPGMTGLLGALYPDKFPNWTNKCPPPLLSQEIYDPGPIP